MSKDINTWDDLVKDNKQVIQGVITGEECVMIENTPEEKAALALLKIRQLIEKGYGGNITEGMWENQYCRKYIIIPKFDGQYKFNKFRVEWTWFNNRRSVIGFLSEEDAKRFLSFPENEKLLLDFYMFIKNET